MPTSTETTSDEAAGLATLDGLRRRPIEVQPEDDEPEDELLEDKPEAEPDELEDVNYGRATLGLDEAVDDILYKMDAGKTDTEKTDAEGRQRWRRARRPAASLRLAGDLSRPGRGTQTAELRSARWESGTECGRRGCSGAELEEWK